MFTIFLLACLVRASSSQRYAERNVLPADLFPSSNTENYDYYAEGYGFDEEKEANVYKWMVEEFPHPRNSSRFCNRLKPSNVCDPDMVLTKEHADTLDVHIRKLYKDTPCICKSCSQEDGGIVVGIALLKHMYLPYNVHPVKAIRSFVETLRRQWRLGRCENDILIVVVTNDRLSYTDVGESTSAYLSIHEAHRIFMDNKAQFSAGNFFEGLRDILKEYHAATRTSMSDIRRVQDKDLDVGMISGTIIGSILGLGLLFFIGIVVYKRCKIDKNEVDQGPQKRDIDELPSKGWSKKDIKVIFGSEKRKTPPPLKTKYHPCETDDSAPQSPADADEVIDFRLATPADTSFQNDTQLTNVTSESAVLEQDLTKAAEDIAKTFPSTSKSTVLITNI